PRSTPFPYPTLFRSTALQPACARAANFRANYIPLVFGGQLDGPADARRAAAAGAAGPDPRGAARGPAFTGTPPAPAAPAHPADTEPNCPPASAGPRPAPCAGGRCGP